MIQVTERDFDFDEMLESSLSEIPPEDIVSSVTPWKKAMRLVLVGFALCGITLNFLCLQYILPALGILLSFLGFRMLRRENGCFFACYILSAVEMLYQYVCLILEATVYSELWLTENVQAVLLIFSISCTIAKYICFCIGLSDVRKKAGLPKGTSGIWLVVWNLVVLLLALVQYEGFIIPILLIIGYILIIRSLFRVMRELDEAGYGITPAKILISDRVLSIGVSAVLICGVVCGMRFFNSYPMAWQEREVTENIQVERVKNYLLYLGFPEYVLSDMTDEDILACAGAEKVEVEITDWALNEGRRVTEWREDAIYVDTVYDIEELRAAAIGVRLNEEGTKWKVIHHFLFTSDPGFFGTESIKLWSQVAEDWWYDESLTGRVLYDKDGITYTAPYYHLSTDTYTHNSVFWGERTDRHPFADFSFPEEGEAWRGYLSYEMTTTREKWLVDSWMNFTHQTSPWVYPFRTANEHSKNGVFGLSEKFKMIQDAIQFWYDE